MTTPTDALVSRSPFQLGYVTTDVDRAVDAYRDQFGIGRFAVADRELQVESPTGALTVHARIALAFVDDLMIELVQPTGGDAQLYTDALPDHGYALTLHHLGFLVDSARVDWPQFRRSVQQEVVFEHAGDPSYLYVDTRATVGHHTEYIWLSADRLAAMREGVPRN